MSRQNAILRITLNVDFNEPDEIPFIRAFLTRLNVLSVKSRPRSAVTEILNGRKLRDQLEAGRMRSREKRNGTPAAKNSSAVIVLPPPAAKIEVKTQKFDPPRKLNFRYTRLKEQRFEPPLLAAEFAGAAAPGVET